jgi:hypothetical protein
VPWREAARFVGSGQVGHARKLLSDRQWWKLEPRPEAVKVDGKPNTAPTKSDLTPPQAAWIANKTWVVYVPRGNSQRELTLSPSGDQKRSLRWFDPRTGRFEAGTLQLNTGRLPSRPNPASEDWVAVVD